MGVMHIALVVSILALTGCAATLAPPPLPSRTMPAVELPASEPSGGAGRLIVDAAGEQAKVSRVTEILEVHVVAGRIPLTPKRGTIGFVRKTELLCISPCILDLRQGAHTLVFEAQDDPARTSTADVVVTARPSVVRHALGEEKPATLGYVGGFFSVFMGGGFVLGGAMMTGISAFAAESDRFDSRRNASRGTFLAVGLVALGVGAVLTTMGVIVMQNNRPEHQDGSTVQWTPQVVN